MNTDLPRTVLLVDANDELREATRDLLEAMGYTVVTAARGEEALALYGTAPAVDLLVADVTTPGARGVELARELLSRDRRLGVVLVSDAGAEFEARRRLSGARARFLRKPFSAGELRAAAESALVAGGELGGAAEAAPPGTGAGHRRPARRRPAAAWALAAAVLVAVAAGVLLRSSELTAPVLPERVTSNVTRGSAVELVEPLGELAEVPAKLAWREVPAAASYRVRILGVDDTVLWEAAALTGRAILGRELTETLHPGVVYFWKVEALGGAGEVLARSGPARFRVEPARRGNVERKAE